MSTIAASDSWISAPIAQTNANVAARRELVLLGLYFFVVIAMGDLVNIRLGVEAMSLVVCGAATVITRKPRAFLRDWWFVLAALFLWNMSSVIAAGSPFPRQLDFMMQADRLLSFGHNPAVLVQAHLAPHRGINAIDWLTAFAYNLHLSEPYIAGYFLWRLNRVLYFQFVASVLVFLLLGFLTFIIFPSIPPWMAATKYHRLPTVINRFGPILSAYPLPFHGTPIFYLFHLRGDAVAAFPSEHAAFPMLELIAFARLRRPVVTAGISVWVALILFTIIYLGEHWVADALAGYLYALLISATVARVCALQRAGFASAGFARRASQS